MQGHLEAGTTIIKEDGLNGLGCLPERIVLLIVASSADIKAATGSVVVNRAGSKAVLIHRGIEEANVIHNDVGSG